MKNVHTNRRAAARLALVSLVVTAIAACSRLPTDPGSAQRVQSPALSRHLYAPDDSTACLSGYVVMGGRQVCNPS